MNVEINSAKYDRRDVGLNNSSVRLSNSEPNLSKEETLIQCMSHKLISSSEYGRG